MIRQFGLATALFGGMLLGLSHPVNAQFGKGKKADPPASVTPNRVVAAVNGQEITREELAAELIEMYGKDHLETMIGRVLVQQSCQARNIEVTEKEIRAELDDFLRRNNLKLEEFKSQILAQQGVSLARYLRDQIWPKLALLKLVKGSVEVTQEDLDKAFEANFGEKVQVRMLTVVERRKAEEIWKQVNDLQTPEEREKLFEDLARKFSTDEATRPYGGKAAPFGRNSTHKEIEDVAFRLQVGELSSILQAPGGHLLLLCVGHIPRQEGITLDSPVDRKQLGPNAPEDVKTYRDLFVKDIERKKLVGQVARYYDELEKSAKIENFLNGDFDPDGLTQPAGDPNVDPTARRIPAAGN